MTRANSKKLISNQKEWNAVAKDLEHENLKLASYDMTLTKIIGDVKGKKVLDYGAGPGILAIALQKMGAHVKIWDINKEMRERAGAKIGAQNAYGTLSEIPKKSFDIIICNLVLCIVSGQEVKNIIADIARFLTKSGSAYIGFCNPMIFNIRESNLDFRFPTGNAYIENHSYKKIKKEGGYEIIESHRSIEWYKKIYSDAGLEIVDELFTPQYELKGKSIKDFVIFRLQKVN